MLDTIREKALAEEISNLVEKGAVAPIKKHQVRLTSPLFVVPKSGGGWRPIIDHPYYSRKPIWPRST